jgi:hypothetical protein
MPSGIYVDLHRSPYHLAFLARHVEPLFTRLLEVKKDHSKSVAESSGMLLTLGNADQLLHTIMHGLCSHEQAIRWIVDAVLLVRQERERIDWDLFHDETVRLEFIEPTIIGLREILRHEPDKDAARVLAQLERQSPPSAVEQWLRDRRLPAIITLWDRTRRNARGPARLALVAKLLIEQHGIVGFAYKATTKGWSYYSKIIRALHERYKRRSSSEDV